MTNQNISDAYAQLAKTHGLLPVKVTPFYKKKIDEEIAALGHTGGPLYRAMYPVEERLSLRAPGEVRDWVDDRAHMPEAGAGFLIQKYPDRMLFLPTSQCAAHCLYCFRQDVLTENKDRQEPGLDEKLKVLEQHLRAHPHTREVILSGGDPLMLSAGDLAKVLAVIRDVETVHDIRMHSRAPIFAPAILTDEKLRLLAAARVRFVFHIIHPYEICGEVAGLMQRMRAAGVRLYNHFPLLRKINDHVDVLRALVQKLQALEVDTFSIYVPEPLEYSASYRLPFRRACKLVDELKRGRSENHSVPDFRFCLDTPLGKVGQQHLIAQEAASNTLVFMYEGKRVRYPDFPEEMDEAGERNVLLWKNSD